LIFRHFLFKNITLKSMKSHCSFALAASIAVNGRQQAHLQELLADLPRKLTAYLLRFKILPSRTSSSNPACSPLSQPTLNSSEEEMVELPTNDNDEGLLRIGSFFAHVMAKAVQQSFQRHSVPSR
jgi:hypothetical protein